MPAPVYAPDGQPLGQAQQRCPSARPGPRWGTSWRASDSARKRQQRTPLRASSRRFGRSRSPRSMSLNGVRALAGDDAHHLLGGHAVGAQRGDERPGRGADVDVELVDRAVDRQQVERAQRADLIDPAGEAAAAEHERGLVAAAAPRRSEVRAASAPRAAPCVSWTSEAPLATGSSLTTLPIPDILRSRALSLRESLTLARRLAMCAPAAGDRRSGGAPAAPSAGGARCRRPRPTSWRSPGRARAPTCTT